MKCPNPVNALNQDGKQSYFLLEHFGEQDVHTLIVDDIYISKRSETVEEWGLR